MENTGMPGCGLVCLAASLSQSNCPSTDEMCLCLDQAYNNVVSSCVKAHCTITESLVVKNMTSTSCGFEVRNETITINVFRYLLFCLGLLFFAMRLASRAMRLAPWGHDDTTILVSGVLAGGWLAGSILEERYGMGRDIWTLEPWQITEFLKVFFAFEILYTFTLGLIKSSILFLYLRLFPHQKFRRIIWATQLINLLLVGSFVIADFLQCRPMSFFWESWDGEHIGHCFNINALAWAHSALNIALDFWMLYLPASQVWSLQMKTRKKIGVTLMFGIGIFLTLTSIIRIQTLFRFANTDNPTRDLFATTTWSYIEITVGIMVACLPGARLFIARYTSSLRTTGAKFPKSLDRSGKRMYLTQEGPDDEGTVSSQAGARKGSSVGIPANRARLPSSWQSARGAGESELELVKITLEGDYKGEDKSHSRPV